MTLCALALHESECKSIHHSFQSVILLSLVEHAVEESLAPLHTHFGSKALASDLGLAEILVPRETMW